MPVSFDRFVRAFTGNVSEDLYKARKKKVDKALTFARAEVSKRPEELQNFLNKKLVVIEAEITRLDDLAKRSDYKTACEGLEKIKIDLRAFPNQIGDWARHMDLGKGMLEVLTAKYENLQAIPKGQLEKTVIEKLPEIFDSMDAVSNTKSSRTAALETCQTAETSWEERKKKFLSKLDLLAKQFSEIEHEILCTKEEKQRERFDSPSNIIGEITDQINQLDEIAGAFETLANIEREFTDAETEENEKIGAVLAKLPDELSEEALITDLEKQRDQLEEQLSKCKEALNLQIAFFARLLTLESLKNIRQIVGKVDAFIASVSGRAIQTTDIDSKIEEINALIARIGDRIHQTGLRMKLSQEQRDTEQEAFSAAIMHGSIRERVEDVRFYFDEVHQPLTPALQNALYENANRAFERAKLIQRETGSVDQAKATLAHLPPQFWPPRYIDSLIGWRKAEEAAQEERIKKMQAEWAAKQTASSSAQVPETWSTVVAKRVEFVTRIKAIKDKYDEIIDLVEDVQDLASGEVESPDYAGLIAAIEGEQQSFSENVSTTISQILNGGEQNVSTDELVASFPGVSDIHELCDVETLLTKVVPGVSAVFAGIELASMIKRLKDAAGMKGTAESELATAESRSLTGADRDGGALVMALLNERDARARIVADRSVDVTAQSFIFAGAVAEATGVGAGVGLGLSLTGDTIKLGQKVVMSGIKWNDAKTAQQLLFEAQAGNPQARQQILANSSYYAKMYIAILAREGNPLCVEICVKRGITERDLKNEVIALDILQKALMKHSEQTDDINVSPERAAGEHLTTGWFADGFAATLQSMSEAFASGSQKISEAILRDSPSSYVSTWVPDPKEVPSDHDLWGTCWSTTKRAAENQAGLVPQKTGLLSLFSECAEKLGVAERAIEALTPQSLDENKSAAATKVQQALDALDATQKRILATQPKARETRGEGENQTIKVVTHEPMLRYLNAFSSVLRRTANQLEQRYFDSGIVDREWAATPLQGDNWVEHWVTNWTSAVEKCRIRGEGQVVGEHLRKYETALKGITETALFGVNHKKYCQAGNHLDQALKILKTLWNCALGFPNLETYITNTLGRAIQARRELETLLNRPLPDDYPSGGNFLVNDWVARCSWAKTKDLIKSNGKAVETALGSVINAEPPANLQARSDQVKRLVDLTDALEEFSNSESETHPKFLQYVHWLNDETKKRAQSLLQQQFNVQFMTPETVNLDKGQWKTTWANALEAGIVPLTLAEEKLVRKKLTLWRDKKQPARDLPMAEQIKWHRKWAAHLAELEVAIHSVKQKIASSGFGNDALYAWLQKLVAVTNEQKNAEEGFESLAIESLDRSIQTSWEMDRTRWQQFKEEAISKGFYREAERPKGLGVAIEAVKVAHTQMQSLTSRPLEEQKTAALKTLDALKKFDEIIDQHITTCGRNENTTKQFFSSGKEQALRFKAEAQEIISRALGSGDTIPQPAFSAEPWGTVTQRARENALIGSEHLSAFNSVKEGIKKCPATTGPLTFEIRRTALEHHKSLKEILPPIIQVLNDTNRDDLRAWGTFLSDEVSRRIALLEAEEADGEFVEDIALTQNSWTAAWTAAAAYLPKSHPLNSQIAKHLKAYELAEQRNGNNAGTYKQRLKKAEDVLVAIKQVINSVTTLQRDENIKNVRFKAMLVKLLDLATSAQNETIESKDTIIQEAENGLNTNFSLSLSDKSWDTAWETLKTAAQTAGLYQTTGVKLRDKLEELRKAKITFDKRKQEHANWDPQSRGMLQRFRNYNPKKLLIDGGRQYINACVVLGGAAQKAKNAPTTVGSKLKDFFDNVISQANNLEEDCKGELGRVSNNE